MIDIEPTSESNINPSHYKCHGMECIDEMEVVFGIERVISFCVCNAWKYRYRCDNKGKHDEDLAKSDWYLAKAKELESRRWSK